MIRIGDFERSEPGVEIEKEAEVAGVVPRAQPVQHSKIVHVHGQDPFEAAEVVAVDAACAAAGEVVAAPARVDDCARIGRFPELIVVRRGGIDEDPFGEPGISNQRTKHAFRDRRAADIAHANEEHVCGVLLAAMFPVTA